MDKNKLLILIRHGATDWNLPGRLNSFTDISLNKQGVDEVTKLAKYIKFTFPSAQIWASPAKRAQETATIISRALSTSFEILSDAREVNFGRFEGKTPMELNNEPDATQFQAWENGLFVEGVESFADAANRANRVFDTIVADNKSDQYILVSHGAFIRVLICAIALNLPPTSYRSLVVDNASISTLQITDKRIRLYQLNNKCYLSP